MTPTGGPSQNDWGTSTVQGPIQLSIEWQFWGGLFPEARPQQVITRENSVSYWQGLAGLVSGSCSNAFGDPIEALPGGGQRSGFATFSAIDHWTIMEVTADDMDLGQRNCDASAAAQLFSVGTASVAHQLSAHPVRVRLNGTKEVNGHHKVLIGQRVIASFDAGGAESQISNIAWSFSASATPITEFSVPDVDNKFRPSTIAPLSGSTAQTVTFWFTKESPNAFVLCSFEFRGIDCSILVPVEVKNPTGLVTMFEVGEVQINHGGEDPFVELVGATHPNQLEHPGMFVESNISTPSEFITQGGDVGNKCFAQSVSAATLQYEMLNGNSTTVWNRVLDPSRTNLGLTSRYVDTVYPYSLRFDATAMGEDKLLASDSPTSPLNIPVSLGWPFVGFAKKLTWSASFDGVVLYRPPGPGSIDVPVFYTPWSFQAVATEMDPATRSYALSNSSSIIKGAIAPSSGHVVNGQTHWGHNIQFDMVWEN